MVRASEAAGLQGGHGRGGRRLSNSEQTPAGDEAGKRALGGGSAIRRRVYIPAWEDDGSTYGLAGFLTQYNQLLDGQLGLRARRVLGRHGVDRNGGSS